jgi:hypothetical protein
MNKIMQRLLLLLVISLTTPSIMLSVSPCDCVDRSLTDKTKATWADEVARQIHAQRVDLLQAFRCEGWTIVYVDPHEADEVFLFYSHDPLHSSFITMWSGAAASNEEQSIRAWTFKNAPGIPRKLARCFAWYVTNGRRRNPMKGSP